MNKNDIRRLARVIVEAGKIDNKTAKQIVETFTRHDLATLALILKQMVAENSVKIVSSSALEAATKKKISTIFANKKIIYEQESTLKTGIKVIINDTIIDLTVGNFIDSAIENLKN